MISSRKLLIRTASALLLVAVFLVVRGLHEPSGSTEKPSPSADTTLAEDDAPAAPSRRTANEADRLLQSEGATTDVGLSTFPIRDYRRIEPPAGKPSGPVAGEAYIHIPAAGRRIAMEANQIGEYPTVETKLNDTIGVRLQLVDVKPGTPVRVAIIDGGSFPMKNGLSQMIPAADWRGVAFEVTTSHNIGFHRILVEAQGHPARILNFSAHDATWPPLSQTPTH